MIVEIGDVHAAAERIAGHVRHTPVMQATALRDDPAVGYDLWLKLELLQATGSFKARGATNKLLSLDQAALARGVVTASGGNHGLATARAGQMAARSSSRR